MKKLEFQRLLGYWQATRQQRQHQPNITTKRHNKRQANGSGMVLRNSSIKAEVQLETVFVNERYVSRLDKLPKI